MSSRTPRSRALAALVRLLAAVAGAACSRNGLAAAFRQGVPPV